MVMAARQRWEVSSSEEESETESGAAAEEEEEEPEPKAEARLPGRKASPAFQCPPDFVPCPGLAGLHLKPGKVGEPRSELWLIKAPADFEPRCFSGMKIPLVGFQTLKSKTCEDKVYNVFGTAGGVGGVCLVLPPETAGRAESCPRFAGCITIGESWEEAGAGGQPRSIPASPVPSIPPGLKLRFQPFGAAPPGWSARKRRQAPNTTPELGGTGEPGAKRRKRAKETAAGSGGEEPDREAAVREESDDSRRKKKKKRRKEQEEAAFQHSDTGTPEHGKREKKRRKEQEEAAFQHSDTGMPEHGKREKKRRKEQEEAAVQHSDTGMPEHGKREKKRRKEEAGEVPPTGPREVDLGHKKKKKKKDKY